MNYKFKCIKVNSETGEELWSDEGELPNLEALYWLLRGTMSDTASVSVEVDGTFIIYVE